ncbi:MAG: D-glycero-alpha-D-manno-heptose-1,7-bisphosphate 7-phosphatase [Fusobacteriaceae bacterium]
MKAIFLDRDGTINVEKDYLYKIEDFEFETGALDALKIFKDLDYIVIVVTNQSGISRGYYSEEDLKKLNNYMIEKVKTNGGEISGYYFCPHLKNCDCRKPSPKMILDGIKDFGINEIKKSFIVGDKISDLEAGKSAGIIPVLVKTGYGKNTLTEEKIDCQVFENLYEFALFLKKL